MGKKILIIDDSESIREILKTLLEKEGFNASLAVNGKDGLQKAKEDSYELILTDLHMPELDGITFISEVRKIEAYKNIPILILTTETQQDEKNRAKQAGATGWIIKPFVPSKIISIVKRVIH